MRFAWLQKNSDPEISTEVSSISKWITFVYNLLWWVPLVLVLLGLIDYGTGFLSFTVYTAFRFLANLYRNNVMETVQAITFPLRTPG